MTKLLQDSSIESTYTYSIAPFLAFSGLIQQLPHRAIRCLVRCSVKYLDPCLFSRSTLQRVIPMPYSVFLRANTLNEVPKPLSQCLELDYQLCSFPVVLAVLAIELHPVIWYLPRGGKKQVTAWIDAKDCMP